MLKRCQGYSLLSDALANAINFRVELTNGKLELKIQMNFIPLSQFYAKKKSLTNRM
jgi:hypothetical protein